MKMFSFFLLVLFVCMFYMFVVVVAVCVIVQVRKAKTVVALP